MHIFGSLHRVHFFLTPSSHNWHTITVEILIVVANMYIVQTIAIRPRDPNASPLAYGLYASENADNYL